MSESPGSSGPFDRALDAALSRALEPPRVTEAFRERMRAALARSTETDLAGLRARLETERREMLAQLDAEYIRLRRRTLGTLIGGAFAAGAAAAIALPWMAKLVGPDAPLAVAAIGAAVGLGIGVSSWFKSRGESGSRVSL
ncbi:MAG: hypothetical protein ACREUT_14235 [Steroidobacteraceae bacterium]